MATDIEMPDATKQKAPLKKEPLKEPAKKEPVDPLDAVLDGSFALLFSIACNHN